MTEKLPESYVKNENGLFEKCEIQWFERSDLIRNKKNFRNFYKPTIDYLIKEYDYIYQKCQDLS